METMDKLKESFYNLLMIASGIREHWIGKVQIESVLNCIDEDEIPFPSRLESFEKSFEVQNYAVKGFIMIQTCSFLEEYKYFCGQPTVNDSEREFRSKLMTTLRPSLKVISKWKELYQVRNGLLAHNWRTKGEAIVFRPNPTGAHQDVPWIDAEYTLLVGVFDIIIYCLKTKFKSVYEEMHDKAIKNSSHKVSHVPRASTHEEAVEQLKFLRIQLGIPNVEYFSG